MNIGKNLNIDLLNVEKIKNFPKPKNVFYDFRKNSTLKTEL